MTKERYESISLHDLREIAKNRGMKRISALKKADLIDAMLKKDEEEARILRAEKLQRRQELRRQQQQQEETGTGSPSTVPVKEMQEAGRKADPAAAQSDGDGRGQTGTAKDTTAQPAGSGRRQAGTAKGAAAQPAGTVRALSGTSVESESKSAEAVRGVSGEEKDPAAQNAGGSRGRFDAVRDSAAAKDPAAGGTGGENRTEGEGRSQEWRSTQESGQSRIRSQNQNQNQRGRQGGGSYSAAGRRQMNSRPRREQQGRQTGTAAEGTAETAGNTVREEPFTFQYRHSAGQEDRVRGDAAFSGGSQPAVQGSQQGVQQEGQQDSGARLSRYYQAGRPDTPVFHKDELNAELDSGQMANGILEVMQDGFGFIRCANYMPGENDIYVAPSQIRRFGLKTGDIIVGNIRVRTQGEKFSALLYVKSVNGFSPEEATRRYNFEDMTPVFPEERIRLERPGGPVSMRIMDLMCPVGKGQRGMIVSPPKAGKTTLIKEVARSVKYNNPEIHLIVLLIDERPEEVTDIREAIEGPGAEVIYSTFDELPEHHKRVSEMAIERARRLVEHRKDVMILLDSITRLTRAYNITEPSSGRTLSGGLDPAALHMPKRFFGAARNMREGGSLTILATALIDTGSKMDDIVFEEFKGTGNMELALDRRLSERRIFPAIDIVRSGTRRDDLLLTPDELAAINTIRRAFNGLSAEQAVTQALDLFSRTRTNGEFVNMVRKIQWGKE